jgi:RNase adaptor protein for sRNA GlmZ degradation
MKQIVQFSYKLDGGPPAGMPVIDCRVIANPYSKASTDAARIELVEKHPAFPVLVETGVELLALRNTIAVGCTWGRHRSGAVARAIAARTGAKIERLPGQTRD